jgi:hypothetical protein
MAGASVSNNNDTRLLETWFRVAAYWLTIAATGWYIGYASLGRTPKGVIFYEGLRDKVS